MKAFIPVAALALTACSQIVSYQQTTKVAAPEELQGVWRTSGAQSGLVSPQATAYLIISPNGDTVDCRQWLRVIAKPGKLSQQHNKLINLTHEMRVMPLIQQQGQLHYDNLRLEKVANASVECQKAQAAAMADPQLEIMQNIAIETP